MTRYSTSGPWLVHTTTSDKPRLYRSVILAAPYDQTGISFSSSSKDPLAPVPQQPYVHLHVTLLSTSSATPNASYFHLAHGAKAPTTLLTTYDGVRRRGHSEPEFNSLTYHGLVRNKEGEPVVNAFGAKEWVVKIFSKKRLSDKWLNEMFSGNVGWVLRKEWDAYPVLPPTTEFPPVKLAEGLYYVNAFEPYVLRSCFVSGRIDVDRVFLVTVSSRRWRPRRSRLATLSSCSCRSSTMRACARLKLLRSTSLSRRKAQTSCTGGIAEWDRSGSMGGLLRMFVLRVPLSISVLVLTRSQFYLAVM